MCTIGAVIFEDGDYALFKNKDFARATFDDLLIVNRDWFGPRGLETFADDPETPNVYSGLSIGANRHGLLCCVDHVRMAPRSGANYDLLTEVALDEGRNVSSAIEAITRRVAVAPSWWGNIVLADRNTVAAVEIRGSDVRSEVSGSRVLRTNHQPLFNERASPDGVDCSASRFMAADRRLAKVRDVADIRSMLSSHEDGQTGVCNHGAALTTVYSYVLHRSGEETALHVVQGSPCRGDWRVLDVPLGETWCAASTEKFVADYPGAHAS